MWHSGQHPPTDLVTLDESGWGSKDVQHFLVLISFQQCSQENHTKQLSTNCKGCLFTSPSQFPGLTRAGPAQVMELTLAITQQPLGLMRAAHALYMELTWAITHHHPGLTRAGSSQDMELTWAGTLTVISTQEPYTETSLQTPPPAPLVRADPEHLRAVSELTAAPGQVCAPGRFSVQPPSSGSSRGFQCTRVPGPCFHPPPLFSLLPGFLS